MCPDLVNTFSRKLEKYYDGLPPQIRDSVMSSKPRTMAEAIEMAGSLTEAHVNDGTLTRKGSKKTEVKSSNEPPKIEVKASSCTTPYYHHHQQQQP